MDTLIKLCIVITILIPNSLFACEHLVLGVPKKSDNILCREGYALGYNYSLKSAEWVSYILIGTEKDGVERTDDFRVDPDIPVKFQTTPEDYEEPVYDMGHIANSESIDGSIISNSETFLMSNMTPQLPDHNRAIWKGLENRERKWALQRSQVIVYSGPVYKGEFKVIGDNNVPVPSHYWKVIYDISEGEAIGFVIPHIALKTSQLDNYIKSVDYIEEFAGVDLLSYLPDSIETSVESKMLDNQW